MFFITNDTCKGKKREIVSFNCCLKTRAGDSAIFPFKRKFYNACRRKDKIKFTWWFIVLNVENKLTLLVRVSL